MIRFVKGMELYNRLVYCGVITQEPEWMKDEPTLEVKSEREKNDGR